ncbi:MAG: HAD family hydrolase [Lachnospiraceae bacterium]|nr:HAD family hydrolase [Lachnospiraceae bacterium]
MKTYRAIFCDIDGTLLTSEHQVTPDTAKKVRELSERGIPFVLTSSRMPAAIYPIQEEIGFQGPIISYGGGLVLDKNRMSLASIGLSQELASKIWKEFPPETEECCFCAYSGNLWMAPNTEHRLVREEETITSVHATKGFFEELLSTDAVIHKLWGIGPAGILDKIAAQLEAKFSSCAFRKSAPHLLEVTERKASKSQAIHILCKEWGISPAETVSFGDNYNDIDMLNATGHSVAMGNAPREVKQVATEVTGENNKEGLLLALNRLFP